MLLRECYNRHNRRLHILRRLKYRAMTDCELITEKKLLISHKTSDNKILKI